MAATTLDVGNLLISDTRLLELKEYKTNHNDYLKKIVQENTQLIINAVFNLPIETVDDVLCAKLPKPATILPREKPLPKAKPLTKWQEYAKLKNIKNVKKTRMVFDEVTKEYKPRFGYKRANDDTKDWLIEVPGNAADPNEDFFAKRIEAKSERKNKNELQRLRNIARSKNGKVRGIPLIPNDQPNKLDVSYSLVMLISF
jgi:regulator of ribosome biosynthesis